MNASLNNKRRMGDNLYNIGSTYLSMMKDSTGIALKSYFAGNKRACLNQAEIFLDSSIAIFKEVGNLAGLIDSYQPLSEVQDLLGEKENALASYKALLCAERFRF
jgi:hypothetical protein